MLLNGKTGPVPLIKRGNLRVIYYGFRNYVLSKTPIALGQIPASISTPPKLCVIIIVTPSWK